MAKLIQVKQINKSPEKKTKLENPQNLPKGTKISDYTEVTPFDDYNYFVEKYKLHDKWLYDPAKYGILFMTEDGKGLETKEEIFEKLKEGLLYFFTEDSEGPFSLQCKEDGTIWVSDEPLTFEEIAKLPENLKNKPVEPGSEPIEPDFSKSYMENSDELIEEKLTEEEAQLPPLTEAVVVEEPWEKPKLSPLKSEDFRNLKFYLDEEAPEEAPASILPKAPEEMTTAQKNWDKFVKLFNKKGSKRGQAYRQRMEEIRQVKAEYTTWKDDFNERSRAYKAERAEEQAGIDRQVAARKADFEEKKRLAKEEYEAKKAERLAAREKRKQELTAQYKNDAPQFSLNLSSVKPVNPDDSYEKYYAGTVKYHLGMRKFLKNNSFAGMVNFKENGLTMDNIVVFEKTLMDDINEQKMDPKNLNQDQLLDLARYLLVAQLNFDIGANLQKGVERDFTENKSPDLREVEMQVQKISSQKDLLKKVIAFKESSLFKATIAAVQKEHVITTKGLVTVYNDAYIHQYKILADDKIKDLKNQLAARPDKKKTEEILVKMVMMDNVLQNMDNSIALAQMNYSDPLTREQKCSVVAAMCEDVDIDYQKQFKLSEELERKYDGKNYYLLPDNERKQLDSVRLQIAKYNDILKAHPNIKTICEDTDAVNKFLDNYQQLISKAPKYDKAEQELKEEYEKQIEPQLHLRPQELQLP